MDIPRNIRDGEEFSLEKLKKYLSENSISNENLSLAIDYIKSIKGFEDLDVKISSSDKKPFIRLKVKLKKEIVTIGDESIDPTEIVGEYVA